MLNSEPYVVVDDCKVIEDTLRAYKIESPHFTVDKNGLGVGMLWVHKALMHPQIPIPTHVGDVDSHGQLVVLKRFVIVNQIDEYTVFEGAADAK